MLEIALAWVFQKAEPEAKVCRQLLHSLEARVRDRGVEQGSGRASRSHL